MKIGQYRRIGAIFGRLSRRAGLSAIAGLSCLSYDALCYCYHRFFLCSALVFLFAYFQDILLATV